MALQRHIDFGSVNKTGPIQTIEFHVKFEDPPVVVVSPWWVSQHSEVGHAETIDEIGLTSCKLVSGNAAPKPDYKVNWIAIGQVDKD